MPDVILACNTALALCGTRSSISSLTEKSKEASVCSLFFDNTRTSALRAARWSFAEEFIILGLLKAAPGTPENPTATSTLWTPSLHAPPWLYSYTYPADALDIKYIVSQFTPPNGNIPVLPYQQSFMPTGTEPRSAAWKKSSDKDILGNDINIILTNQTQAVACYTKDVLNPNLWDSGFYDLFTIELAENICLQLTGDKGTYDRLVKMSEELLSLARVENANEGLTIIDSMPDWLNVRGVYNGGGFTYVR